MNPGEELIIIVNTATVSSTTYDPNLNKNTSTSEAEVSLLADISVIKLVNKKEVCVGERLDFLIKVSNAGPTYAQNVILIDHVTNKLNKAEFSLDRGISFKPWTGSIDIGTLPSGALIVILLRGFVKPTCDNKLINTAKVTSTTPDSNPNNNISRVKVKVEQYCCDEPCCNCCKECCCDYTCCNYCKDCCCDKYSCNCCNDCHKTKFQY